jgi:hypothetical protein
MIDLAMALKQSDKTIRRSLKRLQAVLEIGCP